MKKLMILLVFVCSSNLFAQVDSSDWQHNCIFPLGLDSTSFTISKSTPSRQYLNRQPIGTSDRDKYAYYSDVAQPYQTDTTLTIIGVATRMNPATIHPYMFIADSNMNYLRTTQIMFSMPNDGSYPPIVTYFDTSVDVTGRFYVVIHGPRPEDATVNRTNYKYNAFSTLMRGDLKTTLQMPIGRTYKLYLDTITYVVHIDTCDTLFKNVGFDHNWIWLPLDERHAYRHDGDIWRNVAFCWYPIFGEPDTATSSLNDAIDRWTTVYPNLASDEVDVQCSFKILDIDIADEQGRVLKKQKVDGYHATLDLHDFANGLYIVTVRTKTGISKKKIIKQ